MTNIPQIVRIGTRGSALARWQADHVAGLLREAHPGINVEVTVITTRGDRVLDTPLPLLGGKGLFTAELEAALRSGEIDLAVHSLKDLPTNDPPGLTVGAVPQRARVNDVLVSRSGAGLMALPQGATIGTSSRRRAAQALRRRPDLRVLDIRGNVDTRVSKALDPDGEYDAILLAYAGLDRLGRAEVISEVLPLDVMLPAPGQGALGIQCRADSESLELLSTINHIPTHLAVTAERAFLAELGGGCAVPIAAYAEVNGEILTLKTRVTAVDGTEQVEMSEGQRIDDEDEAYKLGQVLARRALKHGAADLLEAVDE